VIINRHNYEEFFLLYVDKELAEDDCVTVENFVRQNPDLAPELEMLQQTILIDDNITFKQKELLYKKETGISLANYEEYFLLSADNELNEKQAAEVENFVLKNPQLQNEFTLLQQTRLQPEVIPFAGKEKLYRKEKGIRIMSLAFVRMGVAAAIIGIVYISFILMNKNERTPDRIAITPSPKPEETISKNKTDNDNAIPEKSAAEKTTAVLNNKKENGNNVKYSTVNTRKQEKNNTAKLKKIKIQAVAVNVKKANSIKEMPLALLEPVTHNSKPEEAINNIKEFDSDSKSDLLNDAAKNNVIIMEPLVKEDRPLVTRAVYLETNHDDEDKSIYIGSAAINKNKFKGLLRKAAVFLDKKLRPDDN
jgi:hypothetical protein